MSNSTLDLERAWLLNQLRLPQSTDSTADLWYRYLNGIAPGGSPGPNPAAPSVFAQMRTPIVMTDVFADTTIWMSPFIPYNTIDFNKTWFELLIDGNLDQNTPGGQSTIRLRLNDGKGTRVQINSQAAATAQSSNQTNLAWHLEYTWVPETPTTSYVYNVGLTYNASATPLMKSQETLNIAFDMTSGFYFEVTAQQAGTSSPTFVNRYFRISLRRIA